ncbi:MAG: endonuclease/exonuclease/phosphatase family protein, partial [Anaerolineae bacterium]|nr:endonuclease/exonuclease/phosphatase family protein [Anaerolineae bacterium]
SQTVNLEPALALIREADADIVALQELSAAMGDHIRLALADEYPYQALHTNPLDSVSGQGVLSRYPITSDDYWRLYRVTQRVTLDIQGQTVVFYNAHPPQPIRRDGFFRRAEHITDLLAHATQETDPVILAGDFNMSDQSADYWRIAAQYQDSYRASGWGLGLTFPAGIPYFGDGRYGSSLFRLVPPLVRLDYVFHDAAFDSLEARVWPTSGGSDHLPVFVTLAM